MFNRGRKDAHKRLLVLLSVDVLRATAAASATGLVTDGYVFPRGQRRSFGRMDFILRYFRRLFITAVSYGRERQRSEGEGTRIVAWEWTGSEKERRDLRSYVSFIVDITEKHH